MYIIEVFEFLFSQCRVFLVIIGIFMREFREVIFSNEIDLCLELKLFQICFRIVQNKNYMN